MNTLNDTPQTEISSNKMQADLLAILLKSAPTAPAKPTEQTAVAVGAGEASMQVGHSQPLAD